MRLPKMRYASGIARMQQVKFAGLNRNVGAEDGAIADMRNMTGDHYPVLATRERRVLRAELAEPHAMGCHEKLYWVDGTGFWYGGEQVGEVTAGEKVLGSFGPYVIILPDKVVYNLVTGEFERMEAGWSGTGVRFGNGLLYGEAAEANMLQVKGVDWAEVFRPGDAVTISGCSVEENNKTPIIREIDGDKLYFSENAITLKDGAEYAEAGEITVERTVPDMDFILTHENRLWGCKEDTIYASKLGDPFNWNVFDGVDTDSYAVGTGTPGDFTACVAYLGYPIFFKEDRIFKVYGSRPSNFEVLGAATTGVAPGCAGSLAVAGETLFYLSRAGIVAYSGGLPNPVGEALGYVRFREAVAGSDGLKYYAAMDDGGGWRLYVYDTRSGTWHIEDESHALAFAVCDGGLYMLSEAGKVWLLGSSYAESAGTQEEPFRWSVEFADITEGTTQKKGVSKLQVRLELESGSTADVWMQTDSSGMWEHVAKLWERGKRSHYLPVIPRRCDHYRIKIEGTGACRIHELVREAYSGSALR